MIGFVFMTSHPVHFDSDKYIEECGYFGQNKRNFFETNNYMKKENTLFVHNVSVSFTVIFGDTRCILFVWLLDIRGVDNHAFVHFYFFFLSSSKSKHAVYMEQQFDPSP